MLLKRFSSYAFICALALPAVPAAAQNYEDDALLYSQSELIGTARIKAIGGAQVALGGDLGTFGINPAGLGFYRRGDVAITLGFNNTNNQAVYLGNDTEEVHSRFTVPQFGLVVSNARRENDGSFNGQWNNFSFGINHLRTHDLNNRYIYQGYNDASSISYYFADLAYGTYGGTGLPDENNPFYLEDVAYAAGVITDTEVNGEPTFVGVSEFGDVQQYREISSKGGVSETSITLGGNYGNQLFLGAGLTYVNVRRERDIFHMEYDINDPSYPFPITDFDYISRYEQRGTGFNAKLGLIYLPVQDFRVGLSVQTPTFIAFEEDNSDEIATLESGGESYNSSVNSSFEFDMRTPLKLNAGIAKFFGQEGFLSADVEYVDYSAINFDSEFADFDIDINERIDNRFKNAVNVRIGGEYKLQEALALRLGYAYFGNPYADTEEDFSRNYFTGGLGYRYSNIYVDLTAVYNQKKTTEVPYEIGATSPVAGIDHNRIGFMLTLGTRF